MNRSQIIDSVLFEGVRAYSGEGAVAQAELKSDLLALPSFEFAKLLWNQYQPKPIAKRTAEKYQPQWDDPAWVRWARYKAAHESGHLSATLYQGGTSDGVSINSPGGGGECHCGNLTPQAAVLVDMAGMLATDEQSRGMYAAECRSDREHLLRDMRKAGHVGTDDDLMTRTYQLEPIVNDILGATCKFRRECAALLLEQGELGPNEVKLLWQQCQ